MDSSLDIIVIGAGHAGCEAALAAARMGCKTALLTMNSDHIAYMSCNPAIGGQAKGQLAREVDALGGQMGINTDLSALQYKRLNMSRGPAVRSSRAQCDKVMYSLNMRQAVESQENLVVAQREIVDIRFRGGKVQAVVTHLGELIEAKAVVITAGTFLRAVMHCGEKQSAGGRAGDGAAERLSESLSATGFQLVRLKTGTPPRLQKQSIHYEALQREDGDVNPQPFSFYSRPNPFPFLEQMPCYLTYTNANTHEIIGSAHDRSPMFTGQITGRGPRYCPSIEDKVYRFADKERHQIFLEPESRFSKEIYANGLSTSLPVEIQQKFLRTIAGLEKVEIARAGYAVEYDAIVPTVLKHSLESKDLGGLFFAGQVNGTSGYEEAAAQGLVAGVNAALLCTERAPFVLGRDEAYIGVMIDDLVTKGCDEPYRMFTSRAEYRLLLREDTADFRLAERGHSLGLLGELKMAIFAKKHKDYSTLYSGAAERYFYGSQPEDEASLRALGVDPNTDRISVAMLLKRPEISCQKLIDLGVFGEGFLSQELLSEPWILEQLYSELETRIKYEGYIERELEQVKRLAKQETRKIPLEFSYTDVVGLSNEVREKLVRIRPETLGQAQRIPGMTPAAAALLYVHLDRISQS